MNDNDLATLLVSLRALAHSAPPGPWRMSESAGYGNPSVRAADGPLFSTGNARRPRREVLAAARFTAAVNPETVLSLCDVIDQLLAEKQALIEGVDRLCKATESGTC